MSNQYLSFDVTKQSTPQQLITGRQGDSQLKFVTMLFWDGDKNVPYDLTGKQVAFEALKPDNTHIVDYEGVTVLDAPAGLVRYSFNEQVFSVAGNMQQAFFKITHTDSDNNVIADSTLEVTINILENRVEFGINSKDYLSEYDDLIAKVKKKFDDYAATVQDSIDKAQQIHDQIIKYTDLINNNSVVTKSEFGDFGLIKQPNGTTVIERFNNEFVQRGINVKWFGAKGDGVADDTDAIIRAIAGAENNPILFPAGTYLVSKSINLKSKTIVGYGIDRTFIKFTGTKDSLFTLLYENKINGFTLDISDSEDGTVGIELGCEIEDGIGTGLQYYAAQNNIVSDILIKSDISKKNNIGILGEPRLLKNFNGNATGVYNNAFTNISIKDIGTGVYFDAQKNGWFNSNNFDNFSISGFAKNALWIGSTSAESQGIQANRFGTIQIQRTFETPGTASSIVVKGISNNHFNDIFEWNDSKAAAHSRPDVVSIEFLPDKDGSLFTTCDNVILGKVEGIVKGDNRILSVNDIDLYVLNGENNSHIYYSYVHNSNIKYGESTNEIVSDLLDIYDITPRLTPFLFQDGTGIVWPTVVNENNNRYIKLNKTTGNNIMNFTLYANYLKSIKRKGIFTFSIVIYSSNEMASKLNFDVGAKTGTNNLSLNDFIKHVYVEKKSENIFVINAVIDMTDSPNVYENADSINVASIFSIDTSSDFIGIMGVSMATCNVNHLSRYKFEHTGRKIRRVLPATPSSWSDLGVFPLDIGQFEHIADRIYTSKFVSNGYIIEAEYLE